MTALVPEKSVHHLVPNDGWVRFFGFDDEYAIAPWIVGSDGPDAVKNVGQRLRVNMIKLNLVEITRELAAGFQLRPPLRKFGRHEIFRRVGKLERFIYPDDVAAGGKKNYQDSCESRDPHAVFSSASLRHT